MISRLQHLQLAKIHKVGDSQPVGLGHQFLKAYAIYPSNRARVSRQSVAIFFFFFFFSFSFLFLFLFFFFGRHIGLLFMRVLNLLKVVNETRVGYCKAWEARQFFRFLKKPDVHCVWLAKGGRKRSKATRIKLIIHSTRYGINLTSTGLNKFSIF